MWRDGTHEVFRQVPQETGKPVGAEELGHSLAHKIKAWKNVCSADPTTSMIKVKIGEVDVTALVDTESGGNSVGLSLVSELFYNQWEKPHGRRLRPVTQTEMTVGGERLDILGAVCVDVVIHVQQIMQEMLVVRCLKQPVILGWEFLMGNGAITDCANGQITLQSIGVTIKLLKKSELVPNLAVVKCGSDVLIPARSEAGITAIWNEILLRWKLMDMMES